MFLLKENNKRPQSKSSGNSKPLPIYDVKIIAGKRIFKLSEGEKEPPGSSSKNRVPENGHKMEVSY